MSGQAFEMSGNGAVQITLGQVFNEVRAMHDELKSLGVRLEPMRDQLVDHENRLRTVDGLPADVEELKKENEKLSERVSKVEWRQGMWAGGAAVFAGSAGSLITWALTRH